VDAVQQFFRRTGVRLVTLTGPGGVGKTRLALQVATGLIEDFADVFFVPLSSILDPALVPSAIARVLGLKEAETQTLPELFKGYLQQRHLLLVLDNFEHVLPAASLISELLAACPTLRVLVTSRAVLHLSGEHQFPLLPLPVPDLENLPLLDNLALGGLGEVMRCQGDYEQAARFYDESLALFQHLDNKWRIAYLLHNLGHVARAQGNYEAMAAHFEQSFVLFRELGHKAGIADCLAGLAAVAGVQGQQELAVQLFAASQALFTALGVRLDPADRAEYNRNLAAVRTQLEEATFNVAWTQGQQMTWEQIIAAPEQVKRKQNLTSPQPASDPVFSQVLPFSSNLAGLTPREVEVLRLAAQGLSYAQIAERLIISARTVDAHLRSIYSKFGVTSRNEATRFAREFDKSTKSATIERLPGGHSSGLQLGFLMVSCLSFIIHSSTLLHLHKWQGFTPHHSLGEAVFPGDAG
jgi:DNA-binding CsgD family transcriptional regulator